MCEDLVKIAQLTQPTEKCLAMYLPSRSIGIACLSYCWCLGLARCSHDTLVSYGNMRACCEDNVSIHGTHMSSVFNQILITRNMLASMYNKAISPLFVRARRGCPRPRARFWSGGCESSLREIIINCPY